jgi:hypothetical protein
LGDVLNAINILKEKLSRASIKRSQKTIWWHKRKMFEQWKIFTNRKWKKQGNNYSIYKMDMVLLKIKWGVTNFKIYTWRLNYGAALLVQFQYT